MINTIFSISFYSNLPPPLPPSIINNYYNVQPPPPPLPYLYYSSPSYYSVLESTVLHLGSAYWYISINKCDKHKIAILVPNAKHQWRLLPFGLTDAAFLLSYVMFNILEEFRSFARRLYGECIILSKRTDHICRVKTILDKFAKFGIQINFKK